MALTEQQKRDLIGEAFDPQRVTFACYKHMYMGPVKGHPEVVPGMGCPDCWKIWFISELASTPPDQRAAKLDEIEEVLHNMVQMVEAGTWDLKMYPHAKIEFGEE